MRKERNAPPPSVATRSSYLLIPYALNAAGALVHVDEVLTGKQSGAICPVCRRVLIAKNQGKVRAHHFAHAVLGAGCGEGWLHNVAKRLLVARIEDSLRDGTSIPISYECGFALGLNTVEAMDEDEWDEDACSHTGNLLKGVDGVDMEKSIPDADIRPDILLYGSRAKIVEVVHTNAPGQPVLDYARKQDIALMVLPLKDVSDLEPIKDGTLTVRIEWSKQGRCHCKQLAQRKKNIRVARECLRAALEKARAEERALLNKVDDPVALSDVRRRIKNLKDWDTGI